MNRTLIIVYSGMSVMLCSTLAVYVNARTDENNQKVKSIILQTEEVPGLVVRRTENREWVTGDDLSRRTIDASHTRRSHSIYQEGEIQGVRVIIEYAEFGNENEASHAARFRIRNVAAVFIDGWWEGATQPRLGEEMWHTRGHGTLAILVRSGKTCILISCRDGDIDAQARIAEKLAERLVQKAKQGARVPVSETFR